MVPTLISAILLSAIVGFITYHVARRQAQLQADVLNGELVETRLALSNAKTDFEARQEELRKSIDETRGREDEAKTKARESEQTIARTRRRTEARTRGEGAVSKRGDARGRNESGAP